MGLRWVAIVLLTVTVAGCQPMPPMSTDYGSGYAPCSQRAVDNGMCLDVGWRRPLPQGDRLSKVRRN
jgi:hypothetical protein